MQIRGPNTNPKKERRERSGKRSQPIQKKAIKRGNPTTIPNSGAIKNPSRTGYSVIDLLIARALVFAYVDIDYTSTLALARKLAALAERRRGDE